MGKKKTTDPSLKGKKPSNTTGSTAKKKRPVVNPSHIRNKLKRSEMYGKYLLEKKARKREMRLKRAKDAENLGEDAQHEKQVPRTLENTREVEQTAVRPDDEEILADEAEDEFAPYFADEVRPKIIVTTRPRPSRGLFHFIADLMRFIPNLFFYPRKSYSVKDICRYAKNRDFTHLIVLSEKDKVCNGMIVSHLRGVDEGGPTAFFKVSNVTTSTDIPDNGSATGHVPELVLNGFSTRLGHRAGRFLGSLFPHNAQFRGRQVATFHNQRDYIFVRHHRYIFEEGPKEKEVPKENEGKDEEDGGEGATKSKRGKTKARLQELGPRFTLKMRWLQNGMFDTQFGEYEWMHKRKEMDTTRRKFHL